MVLLFSKEQGLLSATLFLFTGTAVFLSKSATGDIIAATFLGLSFYLLLLSKKRQSGILLLAGATALFVAFVTKYIVILYVLSFVIFVLWRFPFYRAALSFLLPLAGLLSVYVILILHPYIHDIVRNYLITNQQLPFPASDIVSWNFQWVEMPYLLAIFGMFHKEKGREGIMLTVFSAPIFLLYFLNGTEQSIEKNMIFSLVFLTHAASLGVDHMGRLFSSNITASWVRPFFTVAVLAVIWVFGIKQISWFEKQYADITPAITFLKQNGHDGMTIAVESADKYQDYIYRYALEKTFPSARFIAIPHDDTRKREEVIVRDNPHFLIFHEYYAGTYFHKVPEYYPEQGFSLGNVFRTPFWAGVQNVHIFFKGGKA